MTQPALATKTPAEPAIDKKACNAIHTKLQETVKGADVELIKLYRDFHAAYRNKVWLAFGCSNHKEYLQKFFRSTALTDRMAEEILRVCGQVQHQVEGLKDLKPEEVPAYTDEVLKRTLTALDNNVTRLHEVARTKFVGSDRKALAKNLDVIRVRHEDSKNPKEFKQKVEKDFGFVNPTRSVANKAAAAARQAKLGRVDVRLSLEPGNFNVFSKTLETISAQLGAKLSYKDMQPTDFGDSVMILCSTYNTGKEAAAVQGALSQGDRRSIAINHIEAACKALSGAALPHGMVGEVAEEMVAVIERKLSGA